MNVSFNFGNWLLKTRTQNKMTQKDLAELILVDSKNISKYEKSEIIPNLHTVIRVCDCLGYEIQIVPKSDNSLKND